ncbi:MAG TPA: hypothetical protein VKY26_09915 [Actinomycetota bacterium]|nr:hypothetical protein [Actinomycetota bacterium]
MEVLALAGLAWAGDLVGHWLAYVLAAPNVTARDALLLATGHQVYWHAAIATAAVFGAAALVAFAWQGFARGMRHPSVKRSWDGRWLALAGRLAPLQAAIYVVQETLERLLSHAPLSTLFVGQVLLLGIALQLIIGCALALVIAGLGRAAEEIGVAVGGARPPTRPAPRSLPGSAHHSPPPRIGEFRPRLTRGPPALG